MRYAWIERHRWCWPVSVQCEVLGVSPSGYHEHFRRRASPERRKRLSDDALLVHIKAIHAEARGEYGWPRIWKELLAKGIRVGKERVRKLMALHGIKARATKKVQSDDRFKSQPAGRAEPPGPARPRTPLRHRCRRSSRSCDTAPRTLAPSASRYGPALGTSGPTREPRSTLPCQSGSGHHLGQPIASHRSPEYRPASRVYPM